MRCFYHRNDLDGICSGAIVRHRYPDCKMIGFDYGDHFSFESLNPKELVILVDISLSPEEMINFIKKEMKVIWIDHHHSALVNAETYKYNEIRGLRRTGVGACELAWRYFFEDPVPRSVHMLSQYDVWDHTDSRVVPFQYGIGALGLSVYNSIWLQIFDDRIIDRAIQTGLKILSYVKQATKKIFRETGYKDTWEGCVTIFMNSCILDSTVYTFLPQADLFDCDVIASYYKRFDRRYKVSLRSYKEGIDVSKIATKYGGGGHKSAAGFICNELPF